MKEYNSPTLVEYGSVSQLTARLGQSTQADILFTNTGDNIPGTGSRDTCESPLEDPRCLPGTGV